MKKIQYAFVITSILVGSLVLAGEPTKEELQAKLETKTLQMEILKRDTLVIRFIELVNEADRLQKKIDEIDKKSKEVKKNEKAIPNPAIK